MASNFPLSAAICLAFGAASCGGGSGSQADDSSPRTIVTEQPISPMTVSESASLAIARAKRSEGRSDSFLMSRVVFGFNRARQQRPVLYGKTDTRCSSLTCTWLRGNVEQTVWNEFVEPGTDPYEFTFENHLSFFEDITVSRALARQGVTMFAITGDQQPGEPGVAEQGIGEVAVLDDSAFGTFELRYIDTNDEFLFVRYGMARGDLTGSRPSTSGVYRGAMIGNDKEDWSAINRSATLTYTVSGTGEALSADLGIANYSDILVSSTGTFSKSSGTPDSIQGTFIQGAFYGSGGGEVAGTFETSTHIGAFGAKR